MAKPGPKPRTITKDETLTVASRTNGQEKPFRDDSGDDQEQEEKFLTDMLAGYSYWNKQPGNQARAYAAAYRTLLNEFTAEETKE
jgi:hypothetical protein